MSADTTRQDLINSILDTHQAASFLNLSPNTLSRWRWSGDGPRFAKLGRAVRYRRADLERWLDDCSREHTV